MGVAGLMGEVGLPPLPNPSPTRGEGLCSLGVAELMGEVGFCPLSPTPLPQGERGSMLCLSRGGLGLIAPGLWVFCLVWVFRRPWAVCAWG